MKKLEKLERELKRKIQEVKEKRAKIAELKLNEAKKRREKLQTPLGRPRISKEKLLEIELDAYDRPLPDVALKHDVALRTLYNYGITRKALNRKIEESELTPIYKAKGKV